MTPVRIYTDGSCLGNPGPGGWAALVVAPSYRKTLCGGARRTTNNRMELLAVIKGLVSTRDSSETLEVYTDSRYVYDGITSYVRNWRENGWRKADKSPVKNSELWQRLDELVQSRDIDWFHVRAHAGHPENEFVDDVAREQATRYQSELEQESAS